MQTQYFSLATASVLLQAQGHPNPARSSVRRQQNPARSTVERQQNPARSVAKQGDRFN